MISQLITSATTGPPPLKESSSGIFGPIAKPIAEVLASFYHVVPNYGVAILLLSVAWMIIISPLTLKSTRSMLAMQKLQPELKKLQEQHKNDRQAFAQAQMDLFKERGVSPFGSCLPTILPLPVFFALFRVIDGLSHKVRGYSRPEFLSPHTRMYHDIVAGGGSLHSFGMDLAKNALSGHSTFLAATPFYLLLLIMIGTQYLQTVQMMSRNPAAQDNPQMKMMKYIPIIFGVICIRFPAGVVLYYSMSNLARIGQQSLMYRFDPKVRDLAAREVIEVEAHTREIDEDQGVFSAGGNGGGSGAGSGAKARALPAAKAKPASKSRFASLLEQANQAQQEKAAARSKQQPGRGAKGSAPANRSPGKDPSTRDGGGGGGGKGATVARDGNGNGSGRNGSGRNGSAGNGNGSTAKNGNGNGNGRSGNGSGQVKSKPQAVTAPRANIPKTGAGGRTGARSGGSKKRRGR